MNPAFFHFAATVLMVVAQAMANKQAQQAAYYQQMQYQQPQVYDVPPQQYQYYR